VQRATELGLIRKLAARLDRAELENPEVGEVPSSHYVSAEHFAREKSELFSRVPQIIALESELAEPGTLASVELSGLALLLCRGEDGTLRGFSNACRHRSTRLLDPHTVCRKKAVVCPYHGWTYDLQGKLIHVPHREVFAGRERERSDLVSAAVTARNGFVWAAREAFDLDSFLAPIADELAALGAENWTLYRRVVHDVAGNWKLVIDAFLDAYHIRHLHRDTIYRFFFDAKAEVERRGRHLVAVTARRALGDVKNALENVQNLRDVATPSYLIFPNTILILHPDYLSVIVSDPVAVDRSRVVHAMLIREPPRSEAEEQHWQKSFELIDRGVFVREDLFVVEAMQHGLASGANSSQLFGGHEQAALWFHAEVAKLL